MQRYIQSEKVKKYDKIRTRKVLKKRWRTEKERQKRAERINVGLNVAQYVRSKATKHFTEYRTPENFSLRNNVDEVVSYFSDLIKAFSRGDSVFINISDVKNISSDVILYLLSVLDIINQRHGIGRAKGNAPKDAKCLELLMESGFYDYVTHRGEFRTTNPNILRIRKSNLVMSNVAAEVIDFTTTHLRVKQSSITRSIYNTILECMQNTRGHAYSNKDHSSSQWWLIAQHDKNNGRVNFTFLDNGMGIPHTVRKKLWEKVLGGTDNKLITSALQGDFRAQSGDPWRGKGLPQINTYFKEKVIENLLIISNKGYINHEIGSIKDLVGFFNGTLLSWDFILKKERVNSV